MADGNEGTPNTEVEAPAEAAQATTGTPPQVDEVTTLRSRNAGLDAKVTSLMQTIEAEKKAREAAEAKLSDYVTGKANEDDDTRALLQRLSAELDAERAKGKVAALAAQYPESFSVLGEAIGAMSADQLAAAEARFAGVPVESHTPPPVGNNAARPQSPANKRVEDMTLAEMKEYAKSAFVGLTWESLSQGD